MDSRKPGIDSCLTPEVGSDFELRSFGFRSARSASAFSLIELMVAVSILAFMIVGLLAMFFHVQRAFRAGVTQSDVMEGGRALMSTLTRELQEAAATSIAFTTNILIQPSPGTGNWGEASSQNLESGAARTNYLQDLAFLTEANGEWKGIAYRFDNRNGVGSLLRLETSLPYESNPFIATNDLLKFSDDFFKSTLVNNTNFRPVLDGIVHFFVTAYETNGYVHSAAWLPNAPYGYAFTNHTSTAAEDMQARGLSFTNTLLPAYLEIELGVLESAAAEKFRANNDVNAATGQNYLKRQIGRTHLFRQRIPIRPSSTRVSDAN